MSIFEPEPNQEPLLTPKEKPKALIPSYTKWDAEINCLYHLGGGSTLYDYSGKGNDCTIDSDLSWESGKKWSLRFPDSGAVTTPFTLTDMHDFNGGTFLFWHKYDSLEERRNSQGEPCFGTGVRWFQCGIGNGTSVTAGNLGINIYDGNTTSNLDSGFSPTTGKWYCIAVKYGSVCDGMSIIVNGKEKNKQFKHQCTRIRNGENLLGGSSRGCT